VARRWLLESLNDLDDLTHRTINIIGRELAHHSRWIANTTRTHHPTAPTSYDPCLSTSLRAFRISVSTSPPLASRSASCTNSLQASVNSDPPARHRPPQPPPHPYWQNYDSRKFNSSEMPQPLQSQAEG
jgi:hypothetical protein